MDTRHEADGDFRSLTRLSRVPFGNPTNLLALPRDPLEQILRHLDAQDVKTCSLISRRFNVIIRSSIFFQYLIACHAAGVVDNPRCKLSYAERYEVLLKRERAWRRFQPVFTKTFDLPNEPPKHFAIHNMVAGFYLMTDIDRQGLHYGTLPSTPDGVLRWATIHGHGPKKDWNGSILNAGMAICEHDLVVNVISIPTDTQENRVVYSVNMIPLQFSTGEYHPLARYSRIHVQDFDEMRPGIAVEIAGDNIALVTQTRLFIFDWKTGRKKLQHEFSAGSDISLDFIFVSAETLVIANVTRAHLEVWNIPKEADQIPYQILSLHFPAVSEGQVIFDIMCHGKANAYLAHDLLHVPPRPFHTSIDDAIIMIILRFATPIEGSFLVGPAFALFIHPKSLHDTITKLSHIDTSGVQTPANGTPRREALSIPWSKWGPGISMWLDVGGNTIFWTDPPTGQRWALLYFDSSVGGSRFTIFDFNPYNIHDDDDDRDLSGQYAKARKGDYFSHRNIFAEDVEMGFGCTMYNLPVTYRFQGFLMDEERLLGFNVNEGTVTVFHLG